MDFEFPLYTKRTKLTIWAALGITFCSALVILSIAMYIGWVTIPIR